MIKEMERWLKKYYKNKICITKSAVIAFAMTGSLALAEFSVTSTQVKIGENNTLSANQTIAIGQQNKATQVGSTVIGNKNEASGQNSVSIGTSTKSKGYHSVAIGDTSETEKNEAVAIGYKSKVNEVNGVSIGSNSSSDGDSAISIGKGASSKGTHSVSVGHNSKAHGEGAMAFGGGADPNKPGSTETIAKGEYTLAIGHGAQAHGSHTVSLEGYADGKNSIAIGAASKTESDSINAVAIGNETKASKNQSVSIGSSSEATADFSTAIGHKAKSLGEQTVSINGEANGRNSVAVGRASTTGAQSTNAVAIGSDTVSNSNNSTAIGSNAKATGSNSTAINGIASAQTTVAILGTSKSESGVAIGIGSEVGDNAKYSLALGTLAKTKNTGAIAIGHTVEATGVESVALGTGGTKATAYHSVALGNNAEATSDDATAVGSESKATAKKSLAMNGSKVSGENSVGIGVSNTVTAENTIAIGENIVGNTEKSIYLGYGSTNANDSASKGLSEYSSENINGKVYKFAGGKTTGIVTVGKTGQERRIQNVSAGFIDKNSTDAINGSQLYALKQAVETPMTFKTENGQVTKKLGETLELIGDTPKDISTKVTGNKIVLSLNKTDKVETGNSKVVTSNSVYNAIKDGKTKVTSGGSEITVTPEIGQGIKPDTYKIGLDLDKVMLTYKANGQGEQKTSLKKGLDFKNGTNTTARVSTDGQVFYDVNKELKDITSIGGNGLTLKFENGGFNFGGKKITNIADGTNDSDAVNKKQLDALKVTVVGDNKNIDVEETQNGTGKQYKVKLKDKLTLGTDPTKKVELDGTTGIAKIGNVNIDGPNGHITGLENKTWNGTATSGRAATEDQLEKVEKGLIEKGLGFGGNTGNTKVKLGDQFNIKGEYNGTGSLSGKNIKTEVSGDTLTIKMTENPEFNSVITGKTKIDDDGVTHDGKRYIDKDGLNGNNKTISNVADGKKSSDAVNLGQLTKVEKDINEKIKNVVKYDGDDHTKITLGGNGGTTITNVKDGVDKTDAVNKGQLDALSFKYKTDDGKENTLNLKDDIFNIKGDGKNITTKQGTKGEVEVHLNDKITLGTDPTKQIEFDGTKGTSKVGTVKTNGTTGHITGLENKEWNGTATSGRAATEDQLEKSEKRLIEKGLGFGGNKGTAKLKLGEQFDIKGEYAGSGAVSGKNITTEINGKILTIKMTENPEFESVKTGKTIINNYGVSYDGNTYIGKDGLNANNKIISNVANGIKDSDAVNLGQLKSNLNEVKAGVAQSMAISSIPQVGDNKLFSIGVGAAYYNKQGGFALGISGTEPTNTFIYKLAAGIDTQKQFGVTAGFNLNFVSNRKNPSMSNIVYANDSKLQDKIDKLEKNDKAMQDKIAALEAKIKNLENNSSMNSFKEKLYIIDQFINDSYIPTKSQMVKLKAIVNEINEKYSTRIIDITGHTDINASERYNLQLGLNRANKISELLINLGLKNPQNIRKVSSFGFNNKVNKGLSSNRRVEITIK